ncbi:MAG TPA: sugar phosphate isomerase/epimerase family protein [Actinomycetes bacterium]|nr:sugar phosphate isomerase/epimerase family protein [Actinomycetes bacterium]
MSQLPPVLAATGPFFMFSLEETFELIAEAGFDGAELMITQDRVSQDPHRLGALAARYGVPVPAVHGPFLVATWLVFGTDPKGKIDRCVRFAEAAKVSTVVIHPPYRWQTAYAAWLDEAIPRIREETGVTIAVENMFPVNAGGRALRFFSGTAPAELARWPAVTLDTSHLAVAGGDLMAAWEELADRVVHLHVSNNDGRGRDTHGLLDRGVLPVPEFLEEVGAAGFPGAVTLELDVRTWADDRPALLEVLRENLDIARLHLAAGDERARSRATIRNR